MNLKESILDRLLQTPGKANAVTGEALAQMFDSTYRQVRLLIRELIEDYPIAATTGKCAGYFIIETREEALEYEAVMKGRLIEDALRRRDFRRASRRYLEPSRQLSLSEV